MKGALGAQNCGSSAQNCGSFRRWRGDNKNKNSKQRATHPIGCCTDSLCWTQEMGRISLPLSQERT